MLPIKHYCIYCFTSK